MRRQVLTVRGLPRRPATRHGRTPRAAGHPLHRGEQRQVFAIYKVSKPYAYCFQGCLFFCLDFILPRSILIIFYLTYTHVSHIPKMEGIFVLGEICGAFRVPDGLHVSKREENERKKIHISD